MNTNQTPANPDLHRHYMVMTIIALVAVAAVGLNQLMGTDPSGYLAAPTPLPTPTHFAPAAGTAPVTCQFGWSGQGCAPNPFTIVAPTADQLVCLGNTADIKWTAPSDANTVILTLRQITPHGPAQTIGTFPAGQLSYPWQVDGITPGSTYQVWMGSDYKGLPVTAQSGAFTIENCTATPTPLPAK